MKKANAGRAAIALAVLSIFSCRPGTGTAQQGIPRGGGEPDYEIKGPYVHGNLSIYLMEDKDAANGEGLVTLDEAISKGMVKVHETGDVNELQIENLSDRDIFVQAGDIVKGGQQDRTFQDDLVLKPKSGKVPVASYCVEHGRWSKRGDEEAVLFSSSKNQLASKELKLAARRGKDQGAVWNQVAATQEQLRVSVGGDVRSADSESSLQLTLENEKLAKLREEYEKGIRKQVGDLDGVVGFAMAINGKMVSADLYGSPSLFKRLWPKLLEAATTEAIAKAGNGSRKPGPSAAQARTWMESVETAKASDEDVDKDNRVRVKENDDVVSFESYAEGAGSGFVHKALIQK